jgi:hypothetical protein
MPRHIGPEALASTSAGVINLRQLKDPFSRSKRNRPLDEEEAGQLNQIDDWF